MATTYFTFQTDRGPSGLGSALCTVAVVVAALGLAACGGSAASDEPSYCDRLEETDPFVGPSTRDRIRGRALNEGECKEMLAIKSDPHFQALKQEAYDLAETIQQVSRAVFEGDCSEGEIRAKADRFFAVLDEMEALGVPAEFYDIARARQAALDSLSYIERVCT